MKKKYRQQQVIELGLYDTYLLMDKVYQQMLADNYKPDHIFGILRGGVDFAVRLSHLFGVPCGALGAVHWPQDEEEDKVKFARHILYLTEKKGVGKQILLVDDNAHTGESFKEGIKKLKRKFTDSEIRTAALHYKTCSSHKPRYIADDIVYPDASGQFAWIRYPWESQHILIQGRMEKIEFIKED
jgi:hypoxanthine phosphoribosyltransferase